MSLRWAPETYTSNPPPQRLLTFPVSCFVLVFKRQWITAVKMLFILVLMSALWPRIWSPSVLHMHLKECVFCHCSSYILLEISIRSRWSVVLLRASVSSVWSSPNSYNTEGVKIVHALVVRLFFHLILSNCVFYSVRLLWDTYISVTVS